MPEINKGFFPLLFLLALLGIAQREIKAQRSPDQGITRNRKRRGSEPQTLGDWIRFGRIDQGLTQRELAKAAGLSSKRLHKIETDLVKPSKDELAAIKQVLKILKIRCNAWDRQ